MNRQQKEAVVSDVKKLFSDAQAAFLVGYKGIDVASLEALRKDLREIGGQFKVTKARLMRIAVKDVDAIQGFYDQLKDQVGLVLANEEVPSVAKALVKFSKGNKALRIVSGYFESKVISDADINFLANLPSREVLLSQLLGTIQGPTSKLAMLLNMMIIRLLYVLKQVSEKQ